MYDKQEKIIKECESIYIGQGKMGCLLLHGFTSCPFQLRLLGNFLSEAGYTVSIPLLPGHGTSPKDLRKCNWSEWYEKSKTELFELRKKCEKVYLIGLSMGGSLALHLAAHYEINGIVAMAPGLHLQNKFVFLSHYIHWLYPYSKKRSGVDIRAKEKTVSYNKIPVRSLSQLIKLFKHLKYDLNDIYAPLLIIHAKEDHVIDEKSVVEIYENVSSKNKRILELNESYHIITLDIEKEKVFREIKNFLNDVG